MSKKKNDDYMFVGPEVEKGKRPFIRVNEEVQSGFAVDSDHPESENSQETLHLEHVGGPVHRVVESIKKPAKVNSNDFRNGWDRIFGGKQVVGQA